MSEVKLWQNTDGNKFPSWVDKVNVGREPGGVLLIKTPNGTQKINLGEWIIRYPNGEVFPCYPCISSVKVESPLFLLGV